LGKQPEKVIFIETMEEEWLKKELSLLPACDAVVGIGGGQAIDAAKYFSWKLDLPLISIPTILSVDAFVTPAAGIRKNHEVVYVGETSPDPLIVDFDILRTAPPSLNIAGIGDLLSMHTACYDWQHAENKGKSEFPFSQLDVVEAGKILESLYIEMGEIRKNSDRGLQAIVEGYMKLNTLCLPAGHYRIEEGSEHYLFYELEERLQRPFIHGHIIGLGIYLMSRLQENEHDKITQIMKEVALDYHPVSMGITRGDLKSSLLNLKEYVRSKPTLWYTCINDSDISESWIEEAFEDLQFE
jgi:glycerol-1-phosphate dehydrogenase [NAD(P)+]